MTISEFALRGVMRRCDHPMFFVIRAAEMCSGLNMFTKEPLSPTRENAEKRSVELLISDAEEAESDI
jgi:hypothetical protein